MYIVYNTYIWSPVKMNILLFDPIDIAWDWCTTHQPKIAVLLLFSFALIYITYRVIKVWNKLDNVEKIGNANKLSIESEVKPDLDAIIKSVAGIEKSITALVVYLKTKDNSIDSNFFVARSPIQLTEIGLDILDRMNGKEYIDTYENKLISSLENLKPKTALDVENNADVLLLTLSSEDEFNKIKNYIYNNPVYKNKGVDELNDVEINLDLKLAISIMSVYLRNKYLAVHPELNTE